MTEEPKHGLQIKTITVSLGEYRELQSLAADAAEKGKALDRMRRERNDANRGRDEAGARVLQLVSDVVFVLDDLRLAVQAAEAAKSQVRPEEEAGTDHARQAYGGILTGLDMVIRRIAGILEAHQIVAIEPARGEEYNPNLHEVSGGRRKQPGPDEKILSCLRPGYVHGDRLIRKALVAVTGLRA